MGSKKGQTDFEGHSHEEMLAMVQHADPYALSTMGQRLVGVHKKLLEIGNDLNNHIAYVDWEGESGSAFKEWGKEVAKSTLTLGEFAQTAGKAMSHASATLTSVKRDMPKVPADAKSMVDMFHKSFAAQHDPDGRKEYSHATSQLMSARIEAADQMTKLAQSYSSSSDIINKEKPPTFAPLPATLVPKRVHVQGTDFGSTTSSSTTTSSSNTRTGSRPSSATHRPHVTDTLTGIGHAKHVVAPPPGETRLTSTLPVDTPTHPAHLPPDGPPNLPTRPSVPSNVHPLLPLPPTPEFPGGTQALRPGTPATFRGPTAQSVTGAGQFGPRGPLGTPGMRPPAMRPPINGISGGRPAEGQAVAGRPQAQVARGSVVGGKGAAARPPVGGMHGLPGSGAAGRQGPVRPRLTVEEGGEVGRTPAGAFGRSNSRQEDERRDDGERPDYLVEDDEIWVTNRDVAPPVID